MQDNNRMLESDSINQRKFTKQSFMSDHNHHLCDILISNFYAKEENVND